MQKVNSVFLDLQIKNKKVRQRSSEPITCDLVVGGKRQREDHFRGHIIIIIITHDEHS